MELNKIYLGDGIKGIQQIESESIDLVLSDPPYGTTDNDWDKLPDYSLLFREFRRILKPRGTIVMTVVMPFGAALIDENRNIFKYDMVWKKNRKTDFLNANNKPLRGHENILVFSKGSVSNRSQRRMTYNPQGTIPCGKIVKSKMTTSNYGAIKSGSEFVQKLSGHPSTVLDFKCVQKTVHPTQKPIELWEWLVRTYSNEGDVVVDPFMGSGTTAVACCNLNRFYLGWERNKMYLQCARTRCCSVDSSSG